MLGFKLFFNSRRVMIGVELLQKISKSQYLVPAGFGRTTAAIWNSVLAT